MERRIVDGADSSLAGAKIAVVVLAAGSGVRVGQGRNKAYLPLGGRTAVGMSLRTMATLPGLRRLLLVVRADDVELAQRTVSEELPRPRVPVELVAGGSSRHSSEERALHHLEPAIRSADVDLVLIHDAARPLCSRGLVVELVRVAIEHGGALPGLAVDDLVQIDGNGNIVPLAGTYVRVQTPQVFAAAPLLEAYRRAADEGFEGTDTSACVEQFSSLSIRNVPGEQHNFKITYPHDLLIAEQVIRKGHLQQE